MAEWSFLYPADCPVDSGHSDDHPTRGLEFEVTTDDCTLVAILTWQPSTGAFKGNPTNDIRRVALYTVNAGGTTGTQVVTTFNAVPVDVPDPAAYGWWRIDLPIPYALTNGTRYRAAVEDPEGGYVQYNNYWNNPGIPGPGVGGITSGPLYVPDTANALGGKQSSWGYGVTDIAFPGTSYDGEYTGLDVIIDDGSAGVSLPIGLATETDTGVPVGLSAGAPATGFDAHKNFARSVVASAPSPASSGLSLNVTTGHGVRFPTTPFNATVWPDGANADPSNAEIVRVTDVTTDTLTISRTQEGTSARSITVGDSIVAAATAKVFTDIETAVSALSAVSNPWEFRPVDYGAAEDGATDETTALRATVDAAVAYAVANDSRADVVLKPITYKMAGATVKGGSTFGNAQLPLPIVDSTTPKVILTFRTEGGDGIAGIPHWNQTDPQRSGCVIESTLTAQTSDGTWGPPSVIGGPTDNTGDYGPGATGDKFANLCVAIRGITVMTAGPNPTIGGIDLGCVAGAVIEDTLVTPASYPAEMYATPPTHSWTFGIRMPKQLNNDMCVLRNTSAYGFYFGHMTAEHLTGDFRSIYCHIGEYRHATGSGNHSGATTYASIEACAVGIQTEDSGHRIGIQGHYDCEAITTYHVDDANNALAGDVMLVDNDGFLASPLVRGAANVRITWRGAGGVGRGPMTPPAVPSSTVPLANPFWKTCDVYLSGTFTGVEINGTSVGTPTRVTLFTGMSITLTYSGAAPTWAWVAD